MIEISGLCQLYPIGEEVVAARFEELGITAYGKTEDEAVDACRQLMQDFVRWNAAYGKLDQKLGQSGVTYHQRPESS